MNEQRVLICPPSRRDGDVTRDLLQRAGLVCDICYDAAAIAQGIDDGAGALIMTDAALATPAIRAVLGSLSRQEAWSDLPVVLLCEAGPQSPQIATIAGALTNVTVLDRPTSARTLLSTVQAALRGRRRQYELRDQLGALRVAEEGLRNADRRKDEFLAMLAHELRNPLAPIRNAGELLTRALPDHREVQAAAAIVKRQITHLSRLVDDLLDVSRITQGRIELKREPVSLTAVVLQAMEIVEPLMRDHGHAVILSGEAAPMHVSGDHARLVQCVANILTNSAKYTDGGGEIRVELRAEDGRGTIAITDNGMGITADLLPRIFDLFVQSDRSLDRSQGGLGIGLSVVRRLIEMHGGTVVATSDGAGHGARFEVQLPLVAAPAPREELPTTTGTASRRILIVDDNTDAADSLAMILNMTGHGAESVYGASRALERAAELDPEVILLDIGLPGMDGYEVARRLRDAGSHARLVALTGYGQPDDLRRAQDAGFDAHLVKPVDLQNLLRTVDGP